VKLDIPSDFGRLPNDAEIAIFRVIQECLTNIHRHSDSRTATILIKRDGEYLTAEVSDTGQGIPMEKLRALTISGRTGVGLAGMRERVRQLGGTLDIQSNGTGTLVRTVFNVGMPD
jgi:two-component system NarL family sensor kinase